MIHSCAIIGWSGRLFGFFSSRIEMRHFGVKVSIVEHSFFKAEEIKSDIIEKNLLKLWNRLTPEIRDSYGEKYLVECK